MKVIILPPLARSKYRRIKWLLEVSVHSRAPQMQAAVVLQRTTSMRKWEQNSNGIIHLGGTIKVVQLNVSVRRQLSTQKNRNSGRPEPPDLRHKHPILPTSEPLQAE